eukprot:19429-Heterococcus_DN1.PRE.2
MHHLALFASALLIVGVQGLGTCTFGNGYISITTGDGTQSEPALKLKQLASGFTGNLLQVDSASAGTNPVGTITHEGVISVSSGGTLTKVSGTFDIPHPLKDDPLQRLRHSFVESPLVDNIYTGESHFLGSVE